MTKNRLKRAKLLLLDVDGVLTDGRVTYTDSGEQIKSFSVKDGMGLYLVMAHGVQVGIVTGRKASAALLHRCREQKIDLIFDGIRDKSKAVDDIALKTGIEKDAMVFVGDDLIDLPAMKQVGVSVAVANAMPEVRGQADMVTQAKGGKGAVREVCEAILKAQGRWGTILDSFRS